MRSESIVPGVDSSLCVVLGKANMRKWILEKDSFSIAQGEKENLEL